MKIIWTKSKSVNATEMNKTKLILVEWKKIVMNKHLNPLKHSRVVFNTIGDN